MTPRAAEIAADPAATLAAVARAARGWGAEWQGGRDGGRLALPVVLGLRRGLLVGRLSVVPTGAASSRLVWTLEESRLEVQSAAVAVLFFAAVPLVATVAWPFYPPLAKLLPVAMVLGFAAWWLVIARLRSSGPEEFLHLVGEEVASPSPEEAPEPETPVAPGEPVS
jgi:hypothetical protein